MPPLFSANTGYLWTGLPFVARIRAAARAGFDAVEFHDEGQDTDPGALAAALAEAGLPVVGLNVRMGPTFGRAAIPGEEAAVRRDIDAAAALAERVGAGAIHVLSGRAEPTAAAGRAYRAALRHALEATDRTVLIEPISVARVPGYFLSTLAQAAEVLDAIGHPRLKILFDAYHVAMAGEEVETAFRRHAPAIGHVQIASVPARNEPEPEGSPAWARLIPAMRAAGYTGAFGAEYHPAGPSVEAGLGWLAALRDAGGPG